jgi:hypothetical protein
VWRETAKKRMVAKLKAIKAELKHRRHEPIPSVGAWLRKVISGYYLYHAVPGNLPRLNLFRWRLRWVWWRALSRRSQRCRISWDRLHRLVERWIPVPHVVHPYPMQRFDATHPRRERMRRSARTDLCGGRSAMIVPTATAISSGSNSLSPLFHAALAAKGCNCFKWRDLRKVVASPRVGRVTGMGRSSLPL